MMKKRRGGRDREGYRYRERGRGEEKKKEKQVTETFKKAKRCTKRKNG
jgi:hypothetical protein